jgi:hypothetical protein
MATRATRTRLIVGTAVVALGSVAFGLFDAPSATGIATSVTIEKGFRGVVSAAFPCQQGRTVTVKRFKKKAPDKKIGTDVTDASGNWEVLSNKTHGTYYAKVSFLTVPASGSTGYSYGYAAANCDAAKSAKLHLGKRHRRRH